MKKHIILSLILVAFTCCNLNAQSLAWIKGDTLVEENAYSTDALTSRAWIRNTTNQTVYVQVKQRVLDQNNLLDSNALHWGIAYPFNTNQSFISIELPANTTDSTHFLGYIQQDGDGLPYSGRIAYTFFNDANANDSLEVIIRYRVGPDIGLTEAQVRHLSMFPNPARDFLTVSCDGNIKSILAYDVMGRNQLLKLKGNRIQLGDLPKGIYIIMMQLENGNVLSERLVKL